MTNQFFSAVALATLLAPVNHIAPSESSVRLDLPTPAAEAIVEGLASPPLLSLKPESRLWLEGNSTVRSYKCAATEILGEVLTEPNQPLSPLAGLKAVVREAGITIPVEMLDCDNGTMNGHMKKALKADEHETISYRLDAFEVTAEGEEGQVEMTGWLTIAGQELPIAFPAAIALTDDGAIRLQGQVELDMTEFGVKPPRLMLGTLKVHDQVTVHFDVVFGS